jgi:uncharacterized protein YqhQ
MPFLPVGGQAVLEGVMMRSPSKFAVAVRRPDGSMGTMVKPFTSITRRVKVLGLPILRGATSLFETMFLGITALNFSADELGRDEPKDAKAKPSAGWQIAQAGTVVISFGIGILMFVVLPAKLTGWLGFHSRISFGLVDGLFRLLAFLLYLVLISQWKDMARVLGYHGAEHKAIHALENRAPLTPESVNSFSRLHPRCGTTFLFIVVLVSVVVFTFIGKPQHFTDHLLRIACMPLIAGVAFEFIRLTGKYQNIGWVRALSWPGMQFQLLTTREPDLSMCETAIASLMLVRDDPAVVALEAAGANSTPEIAFIQ